MTIAESSLDVVRRIIGDKWKVLIICNLYPGSKRYGVLKYYLDGVTQKVLTENLRELEKQGLIERNVFDETPARVEYKLTEMGYSLRNVIEELIGWSLQHADLIKKNEDEVV